MYRPIVEMDTCKACHRLSSRMCSAACHVTTQPEPCPVDKPHRKPSAWAQMAQKAIYGHGKTIQLTTAEKAT